MQSSAFAVVMSMLVLLLVPAQAGAQELAACNGAPGAVSLREQIVGCTALIDSAQFADVALARLLDRRGNLYGAAGEFRLALTDFDRALSLDPNDRAAFLGRAITHAKMGEFDAAVADATQAIAMNPNDAAAYFERAFVYASRADYADAIADEGQVIRIHPDDARAYDNRCFYRAIVGEALDQALADCEQALALMPRDATVLGALGFTYLRLGKADQALGAFGAALQLDPGRAFFLFGRGLAEQRGGDVVGGILDMSEAAAVQADIAEVYARYGLASR
ncbi:MAG: tetratricopeptide repeat protein [Mycobacteriales bacterium]